MVNLRDVADSVTLLTPAVLLRSDAPLDASDMSGVCAWPPATVVDLRDSMERSGQHPLSAVAEVLDVSILDREITGDVALPLGLGDFYSGMLQPPASSRLIEALEAIATRSAPVLVHCSAGKDRTGVLVAIVLALVGVPRDQIVEDYVRTDPVIEAVLARLMPMFEGMLPGGMPMDVPPEFMRAPASAIEQLLDALDVFDGGAEEWFLANGGRAAVLADLRTRLRYG